MLELFIKYFTIFLCSIYICAKLLNINPKAYSIYALVFSTITTTLYLFLPKNIAPLFVFFEAIVLFIFIKSFYCSNCKISFIYTIFSYALSYLFYMISALIIVVIYVLIMHILQINDSIPLYLFIAILQIILSFLIFTKKRFKNGMPFLKYTTNNNIGLYICLVILISTFILRAGMGSMNLIYLIPFSFILISLIFIIIWWRSRLKATYIKAVYNRELEILKNELATLKSDNEVLSSLLHKDNKLIPALELTVRNFICSDNPSAQDKDKILAQLNKLSMERKGIINNCSTFNSTLPSTGYMVIDALLNYMMQKCSASDITMNVNIIGNLDTFIGKIIDESDFNTILADLIENAFIATKYNNGKNIYININSEVEFPTLDIYDSGNTFDDNVLMNLGMKRITTHKDSGGTGIGLSSTYGLCKKYNASFVITEDINSKNTTFKDTNSKDLISEKSSSNVITFTKKVSIIFDDKSEYRLKTNNDFHNLQKLAKRVDLIIEN